MAASVYPRYPRPANHALIRYGPDGRYEVGIGAVDIGTGTWTALTQVAADALGVPVEEIRLRIGDTDLPEATVAGGSGGLSSWGRPSPAPSTTPPASGSATCRSPPAGC